MQRNNFSNLPRRQSHQDSNQLYNLPSPLSKEKKDAFKGCESKDSVQRKIAKTTPLVF